VALPGRHALRVIETMSKELVELQEWYLEGLRPKLLRALGSGAVEPSAADELDRRMGDLLELSDQDGEEAA
jgi:hypothetical protein